MIVAAGADHAGFEFKERLVALLESQGHRVIDHGTNSTESVDYPDFAALVAHDVSSGHAERGLLVCGSGIGMAMAANKVHGVRAANPSSPGEAEFSRAHNDANVICIGARFIEPAIADEMVEIFMRTPFEGGRHERRVDKIREIEEAGADHERVN